MQINSKISYLTSSRVLWWIKTLVFLVVIFLLYNLVKSKIVHFSEFKQSLQLLFVPQNVALLILVMCLTPINWAFEAWKWQKLVSKVEKVSFGQAYKGVLIGLVFSTTTPMMIGDYAGKILMLKTDKRLQSIGAVLLGNALQMYVSLLFGTISYVFFIIWAKPNPLLLHILIVLILIFSLVFGIILSQNLSNIQIFLSKNRFLEYLKKYLGVLENYQSAELKSLFMIAVSRYIVFSVQFLLVLKIFQINLSTSVLIVGIGLVFLTKTLISVLNSLGDLSVRELTSIYYFSFFGANIVDISSATFIIWFINVLLPLLLGSIFILQINLTTQKQ